MFRPKVRSNTSENILRQQDLKIRRCRLRLAYSSKGQTSQVDAAPQCQCLDRRVHDHKSMPILRWSSNSEHSIPEACFAFRPTLRRQSRNEQCLFRFPKVNSTLRRPDWLSTKYTRRPYFLLRCLFLTFCCLKSWRIEPSF
jgi:hypothetical protein